MTPDGEFLIYLIEQFYSDVGWKNPNNAMLVGRIPNTIENNTYKEPFIEFTSYGECFNKTGIYGTFNKEKAEIFLNEVCQIDRTIKYRLVEIRIAKETKVIKEIDPDIYREKDNVIFPFGKISVNLFKRILNYIKEDKDLQLETLKIIDPEEELVGWLIKNGISAKVHIDKYVYVVKAQNSEEQIDKFLNM